MRFFIDEKDEVFKRVASYAFCAAQTSGFELTHTLFPRTMDVLLSFFMNHAELLENLKQAMLAKEELKVSVLRMLKAEVMKVQTDGTGTEITEELIQTLIQRMIKQRRDAAEQFRQGNRLELAEKEDQEIALLQAYMPEQMSEEAIRIEVRATKTALGVTDKSGVGKLMGALMGKLKGKADGALIKKIVEEEL